MVLQRDKRWIGKRASLAAGFNTWPINRPHFTYDWFDERELVVAINWDNRSSDPVWYIALELRLPRWLARLLP